MDADLHRPHIGPEYFSEGLVRTQRNLDITHPGCASSDYRKYQAWLLIHEGHVSQNILFASFFSHCGSRLRTCHRRMVLRTIPGDHQHTTPRYFLDHTAGNIRVDVSRNVTHFHFTKSHKTRI